MIDITYIMRFTVVNTDYGHLSRKGMNQLHQMAMLSEITFRHNTRQQISGDAPYAAWLEISMSKGVFANLYPKVRAAGIEVDVEVRRGEA